MHVFRPFVRSVSLVAAALLTLLVGVATLAAPAMAGNGNGNVTTVKVGGTDLADTGNANDPMVDCPLSIEWFGFVAGDQTQVSFATQGSGASVDVPVTSGDPDFTLPAPDDNNRNAAVAYTLDLSGVTEGAQGYHIKVTVTTTHNGVADYDKFKVFWVQPCASPGLDLAKTVRNVTADGTAGTSADAVPGDTVEYVLSGAVSGVDQDNVVISDPIPAGTSYVADSASCTPTCTVVDSGSPLTFTWASLAAGTTPTATFRVTVDALSGGATSETITNTGSIESAAVASTDSNDTTVNVTVPAEQPTPGLDLAKTVRNVTAGSPAAAGDTAAAGNTLEYALHLTVTGTTQHAVQISDTVPAGTSYVTGSVSCTDACTTAVSGSTLTWTWAELAVGATPTASFRVTVDALPAGTTIERIRNVAAVQSEETGSTPSNPTTTTVSATEVEGEKETKPPTPPTPPTPPAPSTAVLGERQVLPFTGSGLPLLPATLAALVLIGLGTTLTLRGEPKGAGHQRRH